MSARLQAPMDGGNERILWVDLTKPGGGPLPPGVVGQFSIYRVHDTEQIDSAIREVKPAATCFEYDEPDDHGIEALGQIQRAHPALPILVISSHYCDALAVCAARARVWNYVVTPYPIVDTLRAAISLSERVSDRWARRERALHG